MAVKVWHQDSEPEAPIKENEIDIPIPHLDEVRIAIARFKNNKATGGDSLNIAAQNCQGAWISFFAEYDTRGPHSLCVIIVG